MSEENNNLVEPSVFAEARSDRAENQEVVEQQPEEQTVEASVKQAETDKEKSFRDFRDLREKSERLAKERDAALAYIKRQEIAEVNKQNEDDNALNLAPDDLVEGKHLSKYDRKIKELEKQVNSYQQQSTASMTESKIKSAYPDFDSVVSQSNLEALSATYPEIATTINSTNDLYSKAVSAYTLIKKLGIYQKDSFTADKETAQANASKPRTATSVSPQQGEGALSHANAFAGGLTPELKKQLYKEMTESKNKF